MVISRTYSNFYFPVKYFLNSYRALSDGKRGCEQLEKFLHSSSFFVSDWKVVWIGVCTILRTSIDLFQIDAKSCINLKIRNEILSEWISIKDNKQDHAIFWEFLRKERDNIIHEYEWSAYESWLKNDGSESEEFTLLNIASKDAQIILRMRGGKYDGRDSLELLKESAAWVEERINAAIHRAGFDPDERRNLVTFEREFDPTTTSDNISGSLFDKC